MVRILHTADWHRGAPGAHPFVHNQVIPSIAKLAAQEKCKYILVAGDLFDKNEPKQVVKDSFLNQLIEVLESNKDLVFVFVVGNHDYTTKAKTYHSLRYLSISKKLVKVLGSSTNRLYVARPGQFLQLDDFNLFVMPEWKELSKDIKHNGKPLVLAWHGTVPGMVYNRLDKLPKNIDEEVAGLLKQAGACYVALGDIHRCMRLTNACWYSGPPVQKAYDDLDGILVVDLAAKVKVTKHQLSLPRKICLRLEFTEGKDTEQSIVDFVKENVAKNNLVKLKFEMPLSNWVALNRKYIKSSLEQLYKEILLENDPIPEIRTRAAIKKVSEAKSLDEELSIIVEEEDFGLDKGKLKKICTGYLHDLSEDTQT